MNSNVVNSATSLTNNITIDADATLGPRDVVITTGTEVLTVPGGFTVTNVDVTAPTLLRLSPASGSTGVPLNTAVTAEFSEPLSRTTVTTTTFQLYDSVTGLYIATTVSLDATGRVATLTPNQLLAVNRTHYVYLNNPITDVAGNHLPGSFNTFMTGFSTDTMGPTLRLANPQIGDTAVARNAKVVLQFDRAINTATIGIGMRLQTGGVTVPGTFVLEDGQQRIRFTPASQLAASTTYVLTLTSELRDVAGNALTNPGTISFTTGPDNDTTAPTVTASTPYYNEADVSRRPVIRAAFSERINPISLTSSSFYLYNYYTNALIRATISIAPDRLSATLIPDTLLEPYWYYYYYLSGFADIAGNNRKHRRDLLHHQRNRGHGSADARLDRPGRRGDRRPRQRAHSRVDVRADRCHVGVSSDSAHAGRGRHHHRVARPPLASVHAWSEPGRVDRLYGADRRVARFGRQHDGAGRQLVHDERLADGRHDGAHSRQLQPDQRRHRRLGELADRDDRERADPIVRVRQHDAGLRQPSAVRHDSACRHLHSQCLRNCRDVHAAGSVPGGTQILVYSNYDGTTTDLAANPLQSLSSSFTTAAIADTEPPTVVMVTPPDGATGIGPAAVVTLTFSEPLHPSHRQQQHVRALLWRDGDQPERLAFG